MTNESRPSWLVRASGAFFRFPLTRIILAMIMVVGVGSAAQFLVRSLQLRQKEEFTLATGLPHALGALVVALGACAGYTLFVRLFERRPATELSPRKFPAWTGAGLLLGVGLVSLSIGILWLLGVYRVDSVAPTAAWTALIARGIVGSFVTAVFEEILARAIIFRIVEKSLGSWWAIAISAVLFGLAHAGNPNATWGTTIGLSIQAGILLGAAYMIAGNLWLAVGLHAGWNFMQSAIFGGALSGGEVNAILTARFEGPAWLAGGGFGVEGSIVATIVCVSAATALLWQCSRTGKVIPGFWKRDISGARLAVA